MLNDNWVKQFAATTTERLIAAMGNSNSLLDQDDDKLVNGLREVIEKALRDFTGADMDDITREALGRPDSFGDNMEFLFTTAMQPCRMVVEWLIAHGCPPAIAAFIGLYLFCGTFIVPLVVAKRFTRPELYRKEKA